MLSKKGSARIRFVNGPTGFLICVAAQTLLVRRFGGRVQRQAKLYAVAHINLLCINIAV